MNRIHDFHFSQYCSLGKVRYATFVRKDTSSLCAYDEMEFPHYVETWAWRHFLGNIIKSTTINMV